VNRVSNQRGVLTTGTTTVGVVTKEGVVLATDRRVTAGYYIAHRKGKKIWKIDNHVAATMSGAVADVQMVLNELTYLAMDYKINHQAPIPIRTLANYASVIMFYSRPMIYIAHMIIGGVDEEEGPVLWPPGRRPYPQGPRSPRRASRGAGRRTGGSRRWPP